MLKYSNKVLAESLKKLRYLNTNNIEKDDIKAKNRYVFCFDRSLVFPIPKPAK